MQVKGLLMKDEHGQEVVVICDQPSQATGESFRTQRLITAAYGSTSIRGKSFATSPGECEHTS